MSRLQKRSRTTVDSGPKARKRRKVQDRTPNTGLVVTDENLQWREVTISGRLGDAEGLSGLEEIDHVQVIKEKDLSRVQFRVINTTTRNVVR